MVKASKQNLVEAIVRSGCAKGDTVLIPRTSIIPSDLLFTFKCLFSFLLSGFYHEHQQATRSNSSTGRLALSGDTILFSHGQLHVVHSIVSSSKQLYIIHYRKQNCKYHSQNSFVNFLTTTMDI